MCTSSMWVGMYRCIGRVRLIGLLSIMISCRYGISAIGVGILEILLGNAIDFSIIVIRPLL